MLTHYRSEPLLIIHTAKHFNKATCNIYICETPMCKFLTTRYSSHGGWMKEQNQLVCERCTITKDIDQTFCYAFIHFFHPQTFLKHLHWGCTVSINNTTLPCVMFRTISKIDVRSEICRSKHQLYYRWGWLEKWPYRLANIIITLWVKFVAQFAH